MIILGSREPRRRGFLRFPIAVSRRQRSIRPDLERLEGRVVLDASALDPSFGVGGVIQGLGNGETNSYDTVAAIAAQRDGKVIEAETHLINPGSATLVNAPLVIRRYNADGSIDSSFGTRGATNIFLGAAYNATSTAPRNLAIDSQGRIVFVTEASASNDAPLRTTQQVVIRLTAAGQPDPSFGSSGIYFLPTAFQPVGAVVVQGDDKVIVTGQQSVLAAGDSSSHDQPVVLRLTTAGVPDTSFNATGTLAFDLPNNKTAVGYRPFTPADLTLAPNGQIYLADNFQDYNATGSAPALTRINANGTLDTTYGTGGTQAIDLTSIVNIAVQTDGKVVLAGWVIGDTNSGKYLMDLGTLIRVNADGTTDATFPRVSSVVTRGIVSRLGPLNRMTLDPDGTITVADYQQVARFLPNGAVDASFGRNGLITFDATKPVPGSGTTTFQTLNALTLTTTGDLLVGGNFGFSPEQTFLARLLPAAIRHVTNDYDGDGKSDIAAELPGSVIFAYRASSGTGDVLQNFGPLGIGQTIPASGDYDGDGITDVAAYLSAPVFGTMAVRPSSGALDTLTKFGLAGPGASIPCPGDYDGDGVTDTAVYLPSQGAFLVKLSGSLATATIPFGTAGAGQTIPAPGDYDGDGVTDFAAYLPSLGIFAYRSSLSGKDVLTSFGQPGAGNSIPAPGDYDGDGRSDLAVYLPRLGIYAYRPSRGGADVLAAFGSVGSGASIPSPGDFDGDGRSDLAVYLPALAIFAYRPSGGGPDVLQAFGTPGTGMTVPAASIPYAQPSSAASTSARGSAVPAPSAAVYFPLTDDLTNPTPAKRKPAGPTIPTA